MRLELGNIDIKEIRFADKSEIKDGVLYVNQEEVIAQVLEDDLIRDAHLEIAVPGESVRITPVKDVIQPRVKVEGAACSPA